MSVELAVETIDKLGAQPGCLRTSLDPTTWLGKQTGSRNQPRKRFLEYETSKFIGTF